MGVCWRTSDNHNVIYPYGGLLFGPEKEGHSGHSDTGYSVDEPRGRDAERNLTDTEKNCGIPLESQSPSVGR